MKKKSYVVSLILIITVGITTLAVGWHEYFNASKNHKLISCDNHIDSNYDMACDLCGQNLPLSSNYIENKEVTIFAKDENLIKVNGMMPKNTFVSSDTIEKEKAFSLAKSYLKNIREEDIILAYDISLDYNGQKYQPAEFNHFVNVSISGADLNQKENVSLLHIIDDEKYEILPVNKISNEEILFDATRFSTYILLNSSNQNSGESALPNSPENFVASSGDYEDKIEISWNMISGIKYRLSYINDDNERIIISEDITSSYTHTGLEKNKSYEYIIEAYDTNMRYSIPISIKGSTKYDDIFDIVNKDTKKPLIDNITITPNEGKIGPLTDVVVTFNVTDINYDYLNGCNLFKDDIEVLINNMVTSNVEKELTKEVITSGEKYTLRLKKIIGEGSLTIRIPSGKILDFAKNGNDEYIINTNIQVVRTEVTRVTNFTATSGDYENKIKLTWEDNNNQNVKYVIEASSKDNNWIVLSGDATSPYIHTGLAKNMSFEYRIKAVKENGDESAYVYTTGRTEHDPLFGDVMIDKVKPIIELKTKTPDVNYIGKTQEITFVFESFDQNYNAGTTTLDKNNFIIKVGENVISDVSRTFTKENITSGEKFTLKLTNIAGNGTLKIIVPEKVITDCALNQNEETTIETNINVVNDATVTDTAPTLVAGTHDINVATNQVAGSVPIKNIVYQYRKSGDSEFLEWSTTSADNETFRSELIENLYSDTEYEIRTIAIDVANNSVTSKSSFTKTLKIDATKITVTHTPTDWTNQNVTATIDWSGDTKYYHEYSLDNKNWTRSTEAKTEVIFTANGTLYARYSDGVGHSDPVIDVINKIDKIKPQIGNVNIPEGKANSKEITVSGITDEGGSGIKGYYINTEADLTNATWTDLTETSFKFTVTKNNTYHIWVIDNAGNISEAYSSNIVDIQDKVTNIDFNSGEKLEVNVFETKTPILKYDGTPKSVTYEIVDSSIASLNENTGAVTGNKEGETILKVTIEDFDGTKYEKQITVKVNAILPTLTIDRDTLNFIYGDTSKVINITSYLGNGNLSVASQNEEVTKAVLSGDKIIVEAIGYGNTTLLLKSEKTEQYLEKEITINVTVAQRTLKVTWSGDEFTYDGSEKEVTAQINNLVGNDTVNITYKNNKFTDAGTYIAEIETIDNPNYKVEGMQEKTHEWVINKAEREITIVSNLAIIYGTPENIEFTYTGEKVTANVISNNINIAKAEIQNNDNGGTITVTGVSAGNTTILLNVPESKNYKAKEATCSVTVSRATGDVVISEDSKEITFIYGDASKDILYSYVGKGKVSVESKNTDIANVTVDETNKKIRITPKNAGETTVVVKSEKTEQYEGSTVEIKVIVNKRPVELEWSDNTFTYDGKEKEITANIANKVGNDDVSVSSYENNKKTNANTYIAKALGVSNENYTITNGKNITQNWEILKADINPTLIMEDYIYAGVKSTPRVEGNSGEASVTYYYYSSDVSEKQNWNQVTNSTYLPAGTYYMYAEISQSENYNGATTNAVSFNIIVGAVDVILTKNGEAYSGEWTNQTVTATIVVAEEVKNLTAVYYRYEGETDYNIPSKTNITGNTCIIDFETTLNKKVYFVGVDVSGRNVTAESIGYVIKIDKEKPVIGNVSTTAEKGNTKIITASSIVDYGGSGIHGYFVNDKANITNATWTTFTGNSFTYEALENKRYYFYVIDNAGNVSDITENTQIGITQIVDKISNLEYDNEVTVKVFETVKANITYSGEPKEIIYEIEDTNIAVVDSESGVIEGKNAGTTNLKVTFKNYDGTTEEITITVKVERAKPEMTVNSKVSLVYGNSPEEISYTYTGKGKVNATSYDSNVVNVEVVEENKKVIITPKKVGTTKIILSAEETSEYEAISREINVTVSPRIIVVEWGENEFTYDGNIKEVIAEVKNKVSGDELELVYSGNKETLAGEYKASIVGTKNSNYTIENALNLSCNWKINKAEREIKTNPNNITLTYGTNGTITFTYSGEDVMASVRSDNATIAEINYVDGNKGGNITVIPKAKGECNVVIEVPESDNYKFGTKSIKVTIEGNANAQITLGDYTPEITYGDEPLKIPFEYDGNGNVTAKSSSEEVISTLVSGDEIIITPEGAGEATVTITAEETSQYEEVNKEIIITVKPRAVELEWSEDTFTYDGNEKEITASVANKVNGDNVLVSSYKDNKKTNAGTYKAEALSLNDKNYTLENAQNLKHDWKINKADREIQMQDKMNIVYGKDYKLNFTYNGEDAEAEVTANSNVYMLIKDYLDGTCSGEIILEPKATGKTIVTVYVPETENYNSATKTCEITVMISDSGLVVNKPTITFTYGDGEEEISYEYIGNGNLEISSSNEDVVKATIDKAQKTITITPENAGKATVTIKASKTDQYASGEANIEIIVNPRAVELIWTNDTFTYDGSEKEITASVTNKVNGDNVFVSSYKDNKKTNAGTYVAEALSLNNRNYTLENGQNITHNWQIKKADRILTMIKDLTLEYGTIGNIEYSYTGEDTEANVTSEKINILTVINEDGICSGDVKVTPVAQGTSKVTILIPETTNYNSTSGECLVVIKRNSTEKVTIADINKTLEFTYGDLSKDISYAYNGNGEVTAEVDNKNIVQATVNPNKTITVNPLNAGTTTITIKAAQTEQYEVSSVTINVVVKQKIVELEWSASSFIYDGAQKEVTASITNKVTGDTVEVIEYEKNISSNITNIATDAGTYTATASTLNNSNYTLVGAEKVSHTWRIEKAAISPIISMEDYIYGGAKKEPTITGNTGSGDVTYYIYSGDDASKAIDWAEIKTSISLLPGKYKMFARVTETKNYQSGESNTVEFEVKTLDIDVTLKENEEDYDQKWTNNDVVATIKVPSDVTTVTSVYYRIDGEETLRYYNGTIKNETTYTINFNQNFNHKIYFVGVNTEGKAVTNEKGPYEIKIDKDKPEIGSISVPTGKANSKVVTISNITDKGGSGVTEYYIGDTDISNTSVWNKFSGDSFEHELFENGTYFVYVRDGAGNVSEGGTTSVIWLQGIVDKVSNVKIQDEVLVEVYEKVVPKLEYSGEPKEIKYLVEDTNIATVEEITGVITGQSSGETILVVILKDYDGTETKVQTKVKVIPRDPEIIVNEPSELVFVYGDPFKETTYTYDGDGNVSISSANEEIATVATDENRIVVTPHKAGNTVIKIETTGTSKYKEGLKEINVVVNPKPLVLKWSGDNFVYDGEEKKVTATPTNLIGTDEVTLTYKDNAKTNAGKYTAEVVAVDNPNYTVVNGTNIKYDWEIKRAKRETTVTPTEITIDYGTTAEIEYTFTGENTEARANTSAETVAVIEHNKLQNGGKIVIIAEGYGECRVEIEVPETQNYDKATIICNVKVNRAKPEFRAEEPNVELTYGDPEFETKYIYNGNSTQFTISASDEDVIKARLDGEKVIITPIGEGTAKVTLTVGKTFQYEQATATIDVVVKPLPVKLEWGQDEFVYDGREKEITATIKNLIGADKVDITYSGNKEIMAGTYTAEAIGVNNHNYTVVSGENITHEWKIKKAKREIEVQEEISLVYGNEGSVEFRYNGEDVEAEVLNENINIAEILYEDGNNKGTIKITPIGAGETLVTINVPESKNFESATATFIIKVSRAVPEIKANENDIEFIYGDRTKNISYTYNGNGKLTATSSDDNIAIASVSEGKINITPKNVGTVVVTVVSTETNQYTSVQTTINVKVKPRPIDVRWGTTTFIYDGNEKEVTATVRNIVPDDVVRITGYDGNKATQRGKYTATVTEVSNPNYTVTGGTNLTTNWEIKELLPPEIIVKQGDQIIESGTWASGDVEVTIRESETTAVDITFEYSYNGEDWLAYNEPFTISRETRETIIYARAYNKVNGEAMSLIGQYKLKLDKTDPDIRVTSIETTSPVNGVVNNKTKVTVELAIEDLISGIGKDEFTEDDIKVILMNKGIQTELTNINKVLTPDGANQTLEYGNYKYRLVLDGITGNGSLYLKIGEKAVYDRALRYSQAVSINLGLNVDNEGPDVGIIKTSADSYGRVFEEKVDLSVTAKDESGILSYEWQYSKDGKTWETFEKVETSAELSEVIYNAIKEGIYYFRVIVSDVIGNTTISQTAKVNINMQINRKPTIRFETEQVTETKVKITAIIKSTRAIESVKVNASEFEKSEWKDNTVKTNNELTITLDYMATSNGTYAWTVTDDLENTVTEKINITTIDETRVIVSYKKYDVTEYSSARIEFEGNQQMKITKVIKPNGTSTKIEKGNESAGIIFNTTKYKKNITARLTSFEKGTKFVFENMSGLETEVEVKEDIETNVMYIRIAEGLKTFDEIYGDSFGMEQAKTLLDQMLSKTKGINGSIEAYYGIASTAIKSTVSSQEQLMAVAYLSASTSSGTRLRMNQYGDPETLKATIKLRDTNSYTTYMNNNITSVANYGNILNWTGSAIKNTFRTTLRAK